MKKLHITLFLVFLCNIAFAQDNLTDGYIITNTNDTIYGKIDLRTTSINQQKCFFTSDTTGNQTYLPGDIRGYRYTSPGKYYVSKEIMIEQKQLFIFAEYLVEGGLSLYYIKEKDQPYFLFEEEGKESFYITQNPPEKVGSGIRYDYKYTGVILYHLKDSSPTLLSMIGKAKFDQKTMIAITKQYNDENCLNPEQESCIIFENQNPDKENIKMKLSAYTGIQNTSYKDSYDMSGSSTYPIIGMQLYLCNPAWSKDIGLIGDLSFSSMKDEFSIFDISPTNNNYQIKYDFYTLALKVGAKYTYSKFKFSPTILGGFAHTSIIKNNSELQQAGKTLAEYGARRNHTGAFLAAGIEYNIKKSQAIFVLFNYDFYLKSDRTQDNPLDKIKLWQLKVGYTF